MYINGDVLMSMVRGRGEGLLIGFAVYGFALEISEKFSTYFTCYPLLTTHATCMVL